MPKPTTKKVEEVKKKKNYGQTTSGSQQKSGTLHSLKAQSVDSQQKKRQYNEHRATNQRQQRYVASDAISRLQPQRTTEEEYDFARSRLREATNAMNYNDAMLPGFDPNAGRNYESAYQQFKAAKKNYTTLKEQERLLSSGAYDKQAQKKKFIDGAQSMSYENLLDTINSGYLTNEQRAWGEDILREKANSTQAKSRADYYNAEADRLESQLAERYAGGTDGTPEGMSLYAKNMQAVENLRNMAKQYSERGWMAERMEYGSSAQQSPTYQQDAMMVPNRAYNREYQALFGLISDDDLSTKEEISAARRREVMTDEEKRNYSAIYNTQGEAKAHDYLDALGYELDQRIQTQKSNRINERMNTIRNAENVIPDTGMKWLDDYVEKSAKNIVEGASFVRARAANVVSGIGALDATFQKITGEDGRPVNWNTASFTPRTVSQTIQENQLNQIDSSVGRFAYQTAGSMVDSLVVMGATILGVPGATAILGGSAATDSMLKAKERGATDSQAISVGLLSGVAEALFEEVSLEKLLTAGTPATISEAIKNMLFRQGVTEASEEVATTIANTITDALLMGDKSELRTKIRQYVEQGHSQTDAEKLGAIEWFKDLGMDALGGFVSGAIFGGFEQGISYGGMRSDIRGVENADTTGAAIDSYQRGMGRVLDEQGNVRSDSENAAKRLQETYQRTMEGLSDRSTQYEEIAHNIDQQVEQGQMTPEDATVAKAFVEFTMGEQSYNQKAQEKRAKQASELDQKARGMVQDMAEKSTATISSAQSIVDNYDSSIANPSEYFGAFRYYEEMGQQARATGNDNFAEVWKNDERYSGSITQHAAIVAFSAGKTTAAPATKIMQVTQRGTGELTYSEEAMRQLSNNVKSVNDAVELLSAFAKKTGFTVNLDESLADGENAKFIANAMTIAINPRANIIAGLFHESGHAVQRFNPQAYSQLKADMISWYAQTQGMTNMDQMLKQYGKAYKGYSRDALEIEMVNDAFGALFNREDSARDIAKWLTENKTEAEQKSFIDKLNALIDRIINWVKGLVNYEGVSPMQKKTIDMQVEKAQAFRQAFLDALDKASETARTAAEYFADDGSGHDYSMKSFADGLGFGLDEDLNLVNKDGSRVTHVTGDMIRDSKLGAMISYAREHGRISSKDMQTELNMLADILNMALEKGDNNLMMYWEVAGSMVFSALKDNSDKQYGLTVDMSTICAKTKAIVDAMSETMLRLGRGLTREEVEVVYYTTGKNGEPTPCPVCYVFSRWFGIGGLLDDISTFQKEYGKQSTKKDMEFAKRILGEIIEFKDNSSKTKQKDYWSARDNAWKYGRIASDMKSKYNSWISSAEKAIANSDTIRATIAELQAQQALVDEKAAKKLQTQINKEMKKKALLTDEQRQQKFDDIDGYKKSIHEVEAWQWLIKTKLSMDKDGNFTKTEGWKPVPPEILFDLNRGAEFASQYPLTWAYRTGKGSAMGKAMMPYSDVRVGEIAQGVAKGGVKEIKMGIDPDDEIKFNPFNADDAASVKKQLEILKSAVKKTRRQNLIGGMRFQSTSDFRYEYGSDYLMAFLELQALGSNVQLYTKVIEAVDFLASMNADINLSAMPLGDGWYEDETGRHLQSSSVTGINFEAAVEMSRKYDNVQIIMVGINRNHILTCLEGDEVTFVIPFHGSGQNVAQIAYLMDMLRENLDVMRAQDYTNYQSDHDMLKDSRKLTDEEKERGVNTWGLTIEEQARVKAMRDLRMDILTGKLSSGLSDEQRALLKQSKFLGDLYNRFYVDENAREFGVTLEKDVAEQVFPYEYWDKTGNYDNADINGQRFVEYCAEIGYAPRFSGYNSKGQYNPEFDFYSNGQQKGYWKLLIDRPMYANRYDEQGNWIGYGDYREQKAINASKFKMETIDPTWQTATYGNVMGAKNHAEKTAKIAEESIGYLNQGLRYDTATKTLVPKGQEVRPTKEGAESEEEDDTDYSRTVEDINTDYMAAVESGDEDAQSRLVAEAAMAAGAISENGRPVQLYHGTKRFGFTTFDLSKMDDKQSIFLTDNLSVAKSYSGTYGTRKLSDKFDNDAIDSMTLEEVSDAYNNLHPYDRPLQIVSREDMQSRIDRMLEYIRTTATKAERILADDSFIDEIVAFANGGAKAKEFVRQFLETVRLFKDANTPDELRYAYSKYEDAIATTLDDKSLRKARDLVWLYTDAGELVNAPRFAASFMEKLGVPGVSDGTYSFIPVSELKEMLKEEQAESQGQGNYALYAFANNLLHIDAYEKNWDEISFIPKKLKGLRARMRAIEKQSFGAVKDNAEYDRISKQFFDAADELYEKYGLNVTGWSDTRSISAWAKDNGYDGAMFEGVIDVSEDADDYDASNVYVVFSPNQVKSADPVTYDDDGNVIPLTERFNPNEQDIRYSLSVEDFEEYKDQIGDAVGVNINDSTQPFTQQILDLQKDIETRDNTRLRRFIGQRVGLVRTDGKGNTFLVGMATISEEKTYHTKKEFDDDYDRHLVGDDNETYRWKDGGTKYGYVLTDVKPILDKNGNRVELPVDRKGNAYTTRQLAPDTADMSKSKPTSLTDTERRTLEKRVREAERNAAKEKQRAEHFKSEMRLTPKFAPNAEQAMELATELSEMFDGTGVDAEALAQKLTKVFQNMNRATEYKQDRYAYTAMDLAQEIAEDIVGASVPQEMTTTLEGKMMRNEAVAMGTNAIMERLLQVRLAKSTKADKWNAKLQEARQAVGREKTKVNRAAQRIVNLETEFANYRQDMADRIAFLKTSAAEQHSKDMAKLKQTRASRDRKIALQKVSKVVKSLRDYLDKPDPKTNRYVQDNVKKPVAEFLSFIDFFSASMSREHIMTQADYRELRRLEGIEKIAQQSRLMELGDEKAMDGNSPYLDLPPTTQYAIDGLRRYIQSKLDALTDAEEITNSEEGDNDRSIHLKISEADMLDTVYDLARSIQWAVKKMNTLFTKGKYASIEQMSRDTVKHLEGVKKSQKMNPKLYNSLGWSMATPYYAFHRFGEAGDTVFEHLGAGLADFARNINTILDFVEGEDRKGKTGAFTRDEQREWSNQIIEIDVDGDHKLKMTATQLMSLYCLSRREAAQNHLTQGGIALRETKTKTDTVSQEKAVHLTAENWAHVFDQLTDRQKEVARKLQEFMSTVGSDWGNKVTMERWGVHGFTEKFYFPMATSDAARSSLTTNDSQSMSLYALANMGFTKALQKHANNALVLDDIFNVFSDHMANMAKYSSMVLPMLDAMKWYNWSETNRVIKPGGQKELDVTSLKTAVKEAFGGAATQYFRQFMTDLNAADKEGGAGYDIGSRLMSHYKAAAVGANLRVALLQPTAFFRAAMVLSAADLAKGAAMRGGMEEMMKYSGIAQWKDLGFYDTDIGRSVRRQIQGEKTKWGEFKNKAVDISMMAAEWGDKITWAALWNACKIEQQRQNKGVSYEKLMELTERRFNEVVFSTQVFDSTLSRSEVMRSKDGLKKIMTAFLSEPTLSYNMVLDKFVQFAMDVQKLGKGEAWKKHGHNITRALAVYSVTNLVAALAESFADAWRDDDDDPFLKKMMDKMFGDWSEVDDPFKAVKQYYTANLMNDMSVLGKIPILKEFVSLAQGFDIGGRMDVQALQSIKNVLGIWYEKYNLMTGRMDKATKDTWYGNMTTYGAISKTLQAASQVSGLPVYNGLRDVIGIYNSTLGQLTGKVLAYQTKYDEVDKSLDGGTAGINKAIADAVKKGTAEKDVLKHIKSTIKDRYTGAEGEAMSRDQAKRLLMDTVGLKEKATDDLLDEWTMAIDTGISYDKMKESFMDGDITEKQAIDYRVKYGHVAQDKAEATVAGWKAEKDTGYAKDEIADDYNAGNISRAEAIKLYEAFGASNEDATHNVDLLDFKEDHPGAEEFVYTQMVNYQQTCEKHKVPVDVFYDVVTLKGQTHADVDANGNAINGSARKKVLDYINKQPVSTIQKDALYRACGYAESTLKDAPWH